jgi:hypothetical protein
VIVGTPGKHDSTHDGDQDENGSDFKGEQKIVKQELPDRFRIAMKRSYGNALRAGPLQ